MKTKHEILEHIEALEQEINRVDVATSNMIEHRRDDLLEVALNMKDDQLADVEELFWF